MGMDYTVYTNWYRYMSSVFSQIQGLSDQYGQSYTGQVSYAGQSFADTLLNTMLRLNAAQGEESSASAASAASVASTASKTSKSTGASAASAQTVSAPQSMDAIFEEAARLYNVPLNLLKAMGKAESGFDANAVSSAGAQGVMQLMPATARSLGVEDPFDVRSNIMGGAKYIAQKLQQYNGNIDLALAAYNAGSGNVSKYGGVPPFRETINYIARIKEYMNSDLTTGKTVEGTALASAGTDAAQGSAKANGTASQSSTEVAKSTDQSGTYKLSQASAQYLVELMKLQMLSQASMLSRTWTDEDTQNTFI